MKMDKKKALSTLIKHSYVLTDEVKAQLLVKVDDISAEDITALGRFLALEKKRSLETSHQMIEHIDQVLAEIDKQQATS